MNNAILSAEDLKGFQARFLWGMGKDDYDCLCLIVASHAALASRLAAAEAMIEMLQAQVNLEHSVTSGAVADREAERTRRIAAEATIGELRTALETLLNEIDEEVDGGSEYLDQGYWHTTLLAKEEFHWVNFIKAALAAAPSGGAGKVGG